MSALLQQLQRHTTPEVLNGLKKLGYPLSKLATMDRNAVRSLSPGLGSCVGYAVTRRVATRRYGPPSDHAAREASEAAIRAVIASVPAPRILIIQNVGDWRGPVCAVGGVIGAVFQKLGCVGAITNGAARDVAEMEAIGFSAFAGGLGTGGGVIDPVDEGEPVAIGDMVIQTGELIHADEHGVLKVPVSYLADLPAAIVEMEKDEAAAKASGNILHGKPPT